MAETVAKGQAAAARAPACGHSARARRAAAPAPLRETRRDESAAQVGAAFARRACARSDVIIPAWRL
ncbi:MAG: hypothetical protein HZA66_04050 [Rhodopseudomonas palustris]|uniref:Uncharacterized protein n=1 Tax=Rhodopseudomonas palustris TaxID=1076 RepID=A0A933RU09_RHOPL|nr:hypothetical protein [Rhodopseudomonas palustris]